MANPAVLQRAIDALVKESGVAKDQIGVVAVEPTEWSDSSLGCPEPGGFYLQVITPGYRIVLSAAGKMYEYHTDMTNRAVLCQR